jgi:hypothetical protein
MDGRKKRECRTKRNEITMKREIEERAKER